MYILLLLVALSKICFGADDFKIEVYELDNGLTVMLNEDRNASSIAGGVIIKGGGKQDPADATGIAHYLEHMLFKGTNELGTINYETEKILLDSIEIYYDKLGNTLDDEDRLEIQKKINGINIKASEYAIPNEFSLR